MKRLSGKLTYSNVISTLCLVLLLGGGTAYAASQLEKESVGTKQLAKSAVTPAKLSKAAKKALTGAQGPTGPQGPAGAPGAPGREGTPGANLTAETPLASGATETGIFSAAGNGKNTFIVALANFVQPLPVVLDEHHVFNLAKGQTNAVCPGPGRASPGYFCAYSEVETNVELDDEPSDPETALGGANKHGAQIYWEVLGTGAAYGYGSWAVTAP
jgi:hypothetical protein